MFQKNTICIAALGPILAITLKFGILSAFFSTNQEFIGFVISKKNVS